MIGYESDATDAHAEKSANFALRLLWTNTHKFQSSVYLSEIIHLLI